MTMMSLDQWEFTYGMPERIIYLLMLPPVIVVGAALLVINTLAVWWRGYWSAWGRLHYTLVTAACVGLVPFFVYWIKIKITREDNFLILKIVFYIV